MGLLCLLFALTTGIALQGAGLEFEVASVRPSSGGDVGPVGPAAGGEGRGRRIFVQLGTNDGGRFVAQGVPLRMLILLAYDIQDFQLSGGPESILRQRYDIEAKPEAGLQPTREQTLEMLRALLAERFALKVRQETKIGPIYTLVPAKGGSKLKLSADQTPVAEEDDGRVALRQLVGRPPGGLGGPGGLGRLNPGGDAGSSAPGAAPAPGGFGGGRGGFGGGGRGPAGESPRNANRGEGPNGGPPFGPRGQSMEEMKRGAVFQGAGMFRGKAVRVEKLLAPIEGEFRRPVIDKTGLDGLYDIELTWTPQELANLAANLPDDRPLPRRLNAGGPPLPKALQDQLGLKLEQSTGPVEGLVVEKVEKPSEN